MKIRIVSDLHLEFSDWDIKNDSDADVLVLAGDIVVAEYLHQYPLDHMSVFGQGYKADYAKRFRDFFDRCNERFAHCIYVAGNHEFYQGKWNQTIDTLREECARYCNFHFLENDCVTIDDVVFVGAALWTDMNDRCPLTLYHVKQSMNDYRVIVNEDRNYSKLNPLDTVHTHDKSLAYIKHMVSENVDNKVVVVTHHSPSHLSCDEQWKHDRLMNGAFHNNLDDYIADQPSIKLWLHGHTHNAVDYVIGGTRVVCNPRGYHSDYQNENTSWDPEKVVEV